MDAVFQKSANNAGDDGKRRRAAKARKAIPMTQEFIDYRCNILILAKMLTNQSAHVKKYTNQENQ